MHLKGQKREKNVHQSKCSFKMTFSCLKINITEYHFQSHLFIASLYPNDKSLRLIFNCVFVTNAIKTIKGETRVCGFRFQPSIFI